MNQLTVRLEAQRGLKDANTALQNEILSLKALLERRAEPEGDCNKGQQHVETGTARSTSRKDGAPQRENLTPDTTSPGMQQDNTSNEKNITENAATEKKRRPQTLLVGQVLTAGSNKNSSKRSIAYASRAFCRRVYPGF